MVMRWVTFGAAYSRRNTMVTSKIRSVVVVALALALVLVMIPAGKMVAAEALSAAVGGFGMANNFNSEVVPAVAVVLIIGGMVLAASATTVSREVMVVVGAVVGVAATATVGVVAVAVVAGTRRQMSVASNNNGLSSNSRAPVSSSPVVPVNDVAIPPPFTPPRTITLSTHVHGSLGRPPIFCKCYFDPCSSGHM